MNKYLSIILFLGLSTACGQRSDNGELPVIDVVGNLGTYRQVPMSELIEEVEYVPLETVPGSMIDRISHIIVTPTHILIASYSSILTFTRQGRFISTIGRKGRGPGEWIYAILGFSVDEERQAIYVDAGAMINEYTWDGKFVREIPLPTHKNAYDRSVMPSSILFLRDNLFVGHIDNDSGQEPHNWIIFDDEGSVVKRFDNHIRIEKDQFTSTKFNSTPPVKVSGDMYMKEEYNDTLYRLNPLNELSGAFVFDLGRYTFPLDQYQFFGPGFAEEDKKRIAILSGVSENFIVASPNHIFFVARVGKNTGFETPQGKPTNQIFFGQSVGDDGYKVMGMYDIARGKTEFLDRDPISRNIGLVNDIDGGLPFRPRYYNESGNELVQVLEAYEMKELLTEEYFAAHPARDPASHARLRELVKSLDENDNPVVVIAKLKK